MSVKMRQEVERKIATTFVESAIKAGYSMTVDYGDGPSVRLRTVESVLATMFQGDDDRLVLYTDQGGTIYGWVYFVYGNEGWDCINDYSIDLEPVMSEANKIADYYAD